MPCERGVLMTKKTIRKSSLRYRVWRFTHWWREDNDYALRQTNSCKFFWRLVLMPIPATILWVLWGALVLAAWAVVSVFTVALVRGIYTPRFGRWVEFPKIELVGFRGRKATLQTIVEGALAFVILAGVVGLSVTTLSGMSWSGFWEDLKENLRFLLGISVLIGVCVFIMWLKEVIVDWVHRQKERVCHIITFE